MGTLVSTNKHLATASMRKKAVATTVATSSAIEGIFRPFKKPAPKKRAACAAAKPKARTATIKTKRARSA